MAKLQKIQRYRYNSLQACIIDRYSNDIQEINDVHNEFLQEILWLTNSVDVKTSFNKFYVIIPMRIILAI